MRALPVVVVAAVLLLPAPVLAKGPAMTWETSPQMPVAGEPATLWLRTWEWTSDGEPDLTRPLQSGIFGRRTLHLPVRFYPAASFPRTGRRVGVSVPRLDLVADGAYAARVTFPNPGDWVVAWRGHHPGAPERPDFLLVEVRVLSRHERETEIPSPAAGTAPAAPGGGAMPIAGAGIGGLLVSAALLERRRSGGTRLLPRAPNGPPGRLST